MLRAYYVPGAGSRFAGLGKASIIIPILLIRKSRLRRVKKCGKHHRAEQATEADLHPPIPGCFSISRRSVTTIIILTS